LSKCGEETEQKHVVLMNAREIDCKTEEESYLIGRVCFFMITKTKAAYRTAKTTRVCIQ